MYNTSLFVLILSLLLLSLITQLIVPVNPALVMGGGEFSAYNSTGNITLDKYIGKKLETYFLDRLNPGEAGSEAINSCEIRSRLNYIVSLIAKGIDPLVITEKLKHIGDTKYLDENIWVYEGVYRGHKVLIAVGDLGSFYVKIDNGETGSYYACGKSLNESLKETHIVLYKGMKVKYYGQYGELTQMIKPGMICNVSNGTTMCSPPSNQSVRKVLYNPYEVYYVYLDGSRIEPPIRVRGSYPEYTDGFRIVYMEGFVPVKIISKKDVVINKDMINTIVKMFREEGYNVAGPDKIIVDDVYLAMNNESSLIPVLKLRYKNALALVGIDTKGVMLLSFGVFAGSAGDDNGDHGLKINWDSILSNINAVNGENNGSSNDKTEIYTIVLTLALAMVAVYLLWIKVFRNGKGNVLMSP